MEDVATIKGALDKLSGAIEEYRTSKLSKLTAKELLLIKLKEAGFSKISDNKYALTLKKEEYISWVGITITFRGKSADIFMDHLHLSENQFVPASLDEKSYQMISVRYSRVMKTLSERIDELSQFYINNTSND